MGRNIGQEERGESYIQDFDSNDLREHWSSVNIYVMERDMCIEKSMTACS